MEDSLHLARVKTVLAKYAVHPKKRLGQHFVLDKNILTSIVKACELAQDEYVVEIGAGIGTLTGYLAREAKGVLAVEVDRDLSQPLTEVLEGKENIKVLFNDVLRIDIESELKQAFQLGSQFSYKVCGNLPYYITTPIIFRLLTTAPSMRWAVLMVQREVAERIIASPGTKDYGMLTVMVRYRAEVQMLRKVSANSFFPRPEVESALIRITPRKSRKWDIKNEEVFEKLVRRSFQKRRKTVHNIVSEFFKIDKARAAERLLELSVDPKRRPETLGIEEFGRIADAFSRQEAQ